MGNSAIGAVGKAVNVHRGEARPSYNHSIKEPSIFQKKYAAVKATGNIWEQAAAIRG